MRGPSTGRLDRAEPLANPARADKGVRHAALPRRDSRRGTRRACLGVLLRHVELEGLHATSRVLGVQRSVDEVGTTYVQA